MSNFTRLVIAGAVLLMLCTSMTTAQTVTFSPGPITPSTLLQGLGFSFLDADSNGTMDIFIEPNNLLINTITNGVSSFAACSDKRNYSIISHRWIYRC